MHTDLAQHPAQHLAQHTLYTTPPFELADMEVRGRVLDCYDGDTLKVAMPIPWAGDAVRLVTLRLAGVDTPEMRGESAANGMRARDSALRWLGVSVALGAKRKDVQRALQTSPVIVLVACQGTDKYGRTLARISRDCPDDCLNDCLNDVLMADGFIYGRHESPGS